MGGLQVYRAREAVTVATFWIITIAALIVLVLSYLEQLVIVWPSDSVAPIAPGRFVHLPGT